MELGVCACKAIEPCMCMRAPVGGNDCNASNLSIAASMCAGGPVVGLELPKRVFPCATPADVRSTLPEGKDVLAFQVRPSSAGHSTMLLVGVSSAVAHVRTCGQENAVRHQTQHHLCQCRPVAYLHAALRLGSAA